MSDKRRKGGALKRHLRSGHVRRTMAAATVGVTVFGFPGIAGAHHWVTDDPEYYDVSMVPSTDIVPNETVVTLDTQLPGIPTYRLCAILDDSSERCSNLGGPGIHGATYKITLPDHAGGMACEVWGLDGAASYGEYDCRLKAYDDLGNDALGVSEWGRIGSMRVDFVTYPPAPK